MFCRPLTSSTFGSGLSFVNALVPGVLRFAQAQAEYTPVCGLSRLDFVDLWFGAFPRTAIEKFANTKAFADFFR